MFSPSRDETHAHGLAGILHVVPPGLLFSFPSPYPVTVKHDGVLVLRGGRPGRQMGFQRRCHVSSVYPAARVFAFDEHLHERAGMGRV